MADASLMQRFLPPAYEGSEEVVAGFVAALQAGQAFVEDLVDSTTIEKAEGKWLALLARGYGVIKSTGEDDEDLRARLRNFEDKLTRPAIEAAVNAMLAAHTGDQAVVHDWHADDGCCWADHDYCDDQRLFGEWLTFYVVAPLLGEMAWGDLYCDEAYCDDEHHVGGGPDHTIYEAIRVLVERIRAGGTRWLLITEE